MRRYWIFPLLLGSGLASAQTVTSVYNRDTHEGFRLKNVKVESTVVGPLVRTSTLLTYDNPYKNLTESTLNFVLPQEAALGGFAYMYGDEYVRGRLMDKNKAWFIYTAITSRNRDPGIMEQWAPTTYHCQIFPIKQGHDLQIRLWSVGTLEPSGGKMVLPKTEVPRQVGYAATDSTIVAPQRSVRTVHAPAMTKDDTGYWFDFKQPVMAVAQRFKDGRVYVAGLIRPNAVTKAAPHQIEIQGAWYEPWNGSPGGAEVTKKVTDIVAHGGYSILAGNSVLGDPIYGTVKRLRVNYSIDGTSYTQTVPENAVVQLFDKTGGSFIPAFKSLRDGKTVVMSPDTIAFTGWLPRNRKLTASCNGSVITFKPKLLTPGSDTARIWAQQKLAGDQWKSSKDVLKFSLKYGVPSNATALLAVPNEEMRLFEAKERHWQEAQNAERRAELDRERQQRAWAKNRNQNWNRGSGGDPEIRVSMPGVRSVEAILPDRRVVDLMPMSDGTWGGNFEIPADAPGGTYTVRVIGQLPDGTTKETSWTYDVCRAAPKGTSEVLQQAGKLVLQVKAAPHLAEVALYLADGTKLALHEDTPGVYRLELPSGIKGLLKVTLKDLAGNTGEVDCSVPR